MDIYQPGACLMNQGRGLEGLPRLLLGHLLSREFTQFVVDRWKKLFGGQRVV